MFINMWVCNYGNESSLDWDKHLRLLLKFWGCVCMNIWAELLMLPLLARVCECVPALCVCVCVCVCVYGLSVKTAVLLLNGQEQQLQNSPNIKVKLQRERGTSWSQGVLLATADELTGGVCVCVCEVWLSGSERGWPRGRTQTRASPSVSDPAPNWQRLSEPHTLQMCPVPFPSIPLSAPAPLSERRTARERKQESGKKVNV